MVLLSAAWCSIAAAESSDVDARLAFEAPPGCASSAEFEQQIAARTPLWEKRSERFRVGVAIRQTSSAFAGSVTIESEGLPTTREVEAGDCAEVVRALALIVAILIDPEARTDPLEPAPREPEPEREALPGAPEPAPDAPVRFEFGAGISLAATSGIAPALAVGERVHASLTRRHERGLALELRLSVARHFSLSLARGDGSVAFGLEAFRLEGCGEASRLGSVGLWLCFTGEAGALGAEGTLGDRSRSETVAWGSLGGLGRALFLHEGVLELGLELGVFVPVRRYRFWFDERMVFESPLVGFAGGAGAAVRFP